MRNIVCIVILFLASSTSGLFAGGDRPATTNPAKPEVCVTPVGKPPIAGNIQKWSLAGELELLIEDGQTVRWKSADVDQVQPYALCMGEKKFGYWCTTGMKLANEWTVRLTDSSRILANIPGGDGERLSLTSTSLGALELSIEQIADLRRTKSAGPPPPAAGDEDVIALTNGDRLRGVVAGVSAQGLRFSEDGTERTLAWSSVQSVSFAAGRPKTLSGVEAVVQVLDGSRIVATGLDAKSDGLHVQFAGGAKTLLPRREFRSIEVRGGRRDWLSDRPPEAYESTPYLETRWAYQLDKNAEGRPLRLGGTEYPHGVGLHSACKATWRLGGKYERFTALVGIDDSAGSAADADVRILLDGKELAAFSGLHWNEPPKSIDVSVSGGDRLTIEVGFGKRGDVQDRVDVVNPALIRK